MSTALTMASMTRDQLELARAYSSDLSISGYFKEATAKAKAQAKLMYGAELGLGPVQSLLGIDFANGTLSLRSHTIAALIRRSGRYDYRVTEGPNEKGCRIAYFEVEWDATNPAQPKKKLVPIGESFFGPADAKRARLADKQTYKDHTFDMYYNRAMAKGARMHCPDVFGCPVYGDGETEPNPVRTPVLRDDPQPEPDDAATITTTATVVQEAQPPESRSELASTVGSHAPAVAPVGVADGRLTAADLGAAPGTLPAALGEDPVATASPEERATAQAIIAASDAPKAPDADLLAVNFADARDQRPQPGELTPQQYDAAVLADVVAEDTAQRIAGLAAGTALDTDTANDVHAYLVDYLGGGDRGKKLGKRAWEAAGVKLAKGVTITREQAVQAARAAQDLRNTETQ